MIAGSEGLDDVLVYVHGMDVARHYNRKPIRWLVDLTRNTVFVRDWEGWRKERDGREEERNIGGRKKRKRGREDEKQRDGDRYNMQTDRQTDGQTKAGRLTERQIRTCTMGNKGLYVRGTISRNSSDWNCSRSKGLCTHSYAFALVRESTCVCALARERVCAYVRVCACGVKRSALKRSALTLHL